MLIHSFIHSLTQSRYTNRWSEIPNWRYRKKCYLMVGCSVSPSCYEVWGFTALLLKIQVLWDVMLCCLVITGQRLRWAFCLHFQILASEENFLWGVQCHHFTVQCCLYMYTVYTDATAILETWLWFLHAHWLFKVLVRPSTLTLRLPD